MGPVAFVQCAQDRGRGGAADDQIGDGQADLGGVAGVPVGQQDAGFPLQGQVVGLDVAEGAVLAVPGDAAVDHRRIRGRELVEPGAPPRGDTGCEVLHDYVGSIAQPSKDIAIHRIAQIEFDAALVRVHPDEAGGQAADHVVPAAYDVARAGPFDLVHRGAELSELEGAERCCHRLLESDDHDARQGAGHDTPGSVRCGKRSVDGAKARFHTITVRANSRVTTPSWLTADVRTLTMPCAGRDAESRVWSTSVSA